MVRGWLTIGSLAASTGQQGVGWSNGLVRWRNQNPQHPAMSVLGDLDLPENLLLDYPRQIALILPLSGNAAAAAQAIQNGFLGAYFATASGLDERQSVRIYDVNAEGGATSAYATAVSEGAEFVVGPLLKRNVSALANDILVPVPVLTLNYLADDTLAPPGLFQFALSPEDEAMSAAQRAIQEGHTRAVALVPANDWGRRLLTSFATEFEGLGGTLLDYRNYTPDKQDFSDEIESLMGLSGSVQRYRRLRANLGGTLQFDPRRRQDAEFIFLATPAAAGRLLKSQLKFHYSGDLPVYSTSAVNALDGRSNADLNGVMFADTPWVVDPQPWIENLPALFAEYWPEERRLARLHAMGYDAYNLIASLYAVRGGQMAEIDGATGRLYLDAGGRVHRRLAWAQFQRGEVVALPSIEATGGPIENITDDGQVIEPGAADDAPWDRVRTEHTGALGQRAENLAFRYLCDRGLRPVARNFRRRGGEIDIIMLDRDCLVFVEVRYRRSTSFARAGLTVDARKQRKLVRTAALFAARHRQLAQRMMRFDVVAVEGPDTVCWIRDAFRPDDSAL